MKKTVFLPCHPNMWEGFHTIWEREIADTSNKVTVIPIPTYQIGHNETVYDAEYITTGYPENVEICGIDDYDFESEHPDTIYIQNISDNYNPAFTVHPHFYTSALRPFTNNLIYIPYSTFSDADPNSSYLRRICKLIIAPPGIENVDKIIVDSEKSRKVYLNFICEGNIGLYKQWNPRITCENYPRINILQKFDKNTVSYPSSWNRHLFDAAGNRKEAVLYVTSVFGVLDFNRPHLHNAKAIFEEYEKKKDSVALIWRPNKFLPEIIMKYRPELFDNFRALLEYYIYNDIGVFDETPTPTPAIILSDSYIGDECMVKELFATTGKPILSCTDNSPKTP